MIEPWSSVDVVAKNLGVVKGLIYQWIERCGLPAHRIGRLWRFKVSEVDGLVRAGGTEERKDGDRTPLDNASEWSVFYGDPRIVAMKVLGGS